MLSIVRISAPKMSRMASSALKTIKIYRYHPETDSKSKMQTYSVDMNSCGPMVLDYGYVGSK